MVEINKESWFRITVKSYAMNLDAVVPASLLGPWLSQAMLLFDLREMMQLETRITPFM